MDDVEYLLRRFPSDPGQFDFNRRIPRLSIFLPTAEDKDGLSLNREDRGTGEFLTAEQVLACPTNLKVRDTGGVISVLAGSVREDGMTVIPEPADTRGHVLIPELNRLDYDRKETDGTQPGKQRIKALADKLVRRASVRIQPKPKPPTIGAP